MTDVILWPSPARARAVLERVARDRATRTEPLIRLADVPCMGCLARDRVRRPVAECACWDDYLTAAAS